MLDRDLFQRGVYPPIAGLPSLSRLMKDGVGKGYTRDDHPALASQLFAGYAYVKRVRGLADVIGEEELSPLDKQYLRFGEAFETRLLNQGEYENRSIETNTRALGWDMLSLLPRDELHRLSERAPRTALPQEPSLRRNHDPPARLRKEPALAIWRT